MADPIGLGKLAKPVDTIVKKLAGAGYIIYEPTRIRRRAKAEVDAERIKMLGELENKTLLERAKIRETRRLEREQENIEAIASMALDNLSQKALPENFESPEFSDDWLALFLEKTKLVSDEEVQEAWAKILADEVIAPGSFSKQTLNCLANMEKVDAENFQKLCCLSVEYHSGYIPFFRGIKCPFASELGIGFGKMQQLEALGLITVVFSPLGGGPVVQQLPQKSEINYFDQRVLLEFTDTEKKNWKIGHGYIRFTRPGLELRNICNPKPIPGFFEDLLEKLRKRENLKITVINGGTS